METLPPPPPPLPRTAAEHAYINDKSGLDLPADLPLAPQQLAGAQHIPLHQSFVRSSEQQAAENQTTDPNQLSQHLQSLSLAPARPAGIA